jgi:carboxyl-terminal processing protease
VANKIQEDLAKLPKIKGLIIDVRHNPGGLLDEVVDVSSLFLKPGLKIVSIQGKKDKESFMSHQNDITNKAPVVVLINNLSASASEILAAALQDHKRAQVIGVTSFGKGSVQRTFPLSNGGAVKLTTALYYTPNGKSIQGVGVKPDITVESSMVIKGAQSSDNESETDESLLYKSTIIGDPNHDFQLIRALDLIKTIRFYISKV